MRITTNEKLIQRRSKLVRWTSMLGLVVLGGGLIASFNDQYYFAALPALAVGFILANVSAYNANRYVKEPRPDQSLAKNLRGFDNTFHLFNYSGAVSHVFLTPSQLYTFTVKNQDGEIRKDGKRWRRGFSLKRILLILNEESLGNPTRDATNDVNRLHNQLTDFMEEGQIPPISPVVVFTNPAAQIEMPETEVDQSDEAPVVIVKDLKKFLRAQPKGTTIDTAIRKQLVHILKGDSED